ncbi:hypothetical protein J6590_007340 [Homalodisca vitripennis]|nr:hypothetical protein J6590_007340 [Homalodisca vitripennis]
MRDTKEYAHRAHKTTHGLRGRSRFFVSTEAALLFRPSGTTLEHSILKISPHGSKPPGGQHCWGTDCSDPRAPTGTTENTSAPQRGPLYTELWASSWASGMRVANVKGDNNPCIPSCRMVCEPRSPDVHPPGQREHEHTRTCYGTVVPREQISKRDRSRLWKDEGVNPREHNSMMDRSRL